MTWTTLMPGVYSGTPNPTLPHPERNERPRAQPKDVRARQRAHIAARRRELLASDIPQLAPGEHWCCCCGESCGPEGQCERCGDHCDRCDGHYTVLAVERLIPGEYVPAACEERL